MSSSYRSENLDLSVVDLEDDIENLSVRDPGSGQRGKIFVPPFVSQNQNQHQKSHQKLSKSSSSSSSKKTRRKSNNHTKKSSVAPLSNVQENSNIPTKPKKPVRRQKKKSSYPKITDWTIENSDAFDTTDTCCSNATSEVDFQEDLEDDFENSNVDLDRSVNKAVGLFQSLSKTNASGPGPSTTCGVAGITNDQTGQVQPVSEYTIKYLKQQKRIIQSEPRPDHGEVALQKIENSETIKTIINEKAAQAINFKKDQILYSENNLSPIEHPLGDEAILEAAKQAKLKNAPLIVIPPKPEAKYGQPDIYSILPSDGILSYSVPSWKSFYSLEPKNEVEQVSVEDCAYVMGRYDGLFMDPVGPDDCFIE